ncbi:Os11g0204600 [Oryza sativa Japonica Group]|uniref:Os11g0204600 protein n=1 Tax=Oryza sativa subsp. japonica TaxID=39947 RepID=Q0IU01_ORYSJ|nr:Os11g0204600 [Oryza sativa Japonica Group]|eukprot:NP_001067451.2 Os11g0204600 [Oryza sativa Japonica Group]
MDYMKLMQKHFDNSADITSSCAPVGKRHMSSLTTRKTLERSDCSLMQTWHSVRRKLLMFFKKGTEQNRGE